MNIFFRKHPWKLKQKWIILIVEARFSMEGKGSYCILKVGNRFLGSRKVTGIQSHGGIFEIFRHRDGRNFVIGQPLKLTAVSLSSGTIDRLIWSQIQVSAPHFGKKFPISHHRIPILALFCFHKTYYSPSKCNNYLSLP